jgi:hypothetical protein
MQEFERGWKRSERIILSDQKVRADKLHLFQCTSDKSDSIFHNDRVTQFDWKIKMNYANLSSHLNE